MNARAGIIVAALCIGVVLSAEVGLRWYQRQESVRVIAEHGFGEVFGSVDRAVTILHKYRRFRLEHQSYVRWRGVPNQRIEVLTTNEHGFRDSAFSREKPEGVFRIIVMGGSVAWGYAATSNAQTLSGQLEQLLNDTNLSNNNSVRVEVFNMAQIGYTSTQEYILWPTILSYKPDLVIHVTGYNDALVGFQGRPIALRKFLVPERVLQNNRLSATVQFLRYTIDEVVDEIELLRYVYNMLRPNRTSNKVLPPEKDFDFFLNLRLISALAQREDVPLIVVLQPTLFTEKKSLTTGEKKIFDKSEHANPGISSYIAQAFGVFAKGLSELTGAYGFMYVDGPGFFADTHEQVYIDTYHVSDAGFSIMAKKMTPAILQIIRRHSQL